MKVRHSDKQGEKIELQMTPMIDIVFQLLVFFIMTFKIVMSEGDFNMRLPQGARDGPPPPGETPPCSVVLRANDSGTLRDIQLSGQSLGISFPALNQKMFDLIGDDGFNDDPNSVRNSTEVELNCDPHLHYGNVIKAITAISGRVSSEGKIIKMFEKVKFSPRKVQ